MKESFLQTLFEIIEERKNSSGKKSYTKSLFEEGSTKINEKVLEESIELLEATKDNSNSKKQKVIHEAADLWFHTMVLLSNEEIEIEEVLEELKARFGTSGHEEKASRGKSKEEE
ncbi:MAG: phosphoribosyl-ATP diphosphatase [SAR86 cluster bacterium]|jgi:phosphoribosyl-ATP pyrophosphohydrolase|nr:phosphoribosyl-ATP diphosphatase [SAR86 cluster bacterium]